MTVVYKVEKEIAGRTLSIETGKLAKQASGAVLVRYADTIVLATVVGAGPREGCDFFPLTVDYREKTAAAGKFPGGFMKREGRPTTKEILTMRMIDRPIRPMFPKGYYNEVQIQTLVLSADEQNDPDILAMIGSSACLAISDIPFKEPLGAVRVGLVDGEFVINPTHDERDASDMEMVLAGHAHEINMIEVAAKELPEEKIAEGIELGHKTIGAICDMINELTEQCGKVKAEFDIPDTSELVGMLESKYKEDYIAARAIVGKQERYTTMNAMFDEFKAELCPEGQEADWKYSKELIRMAKDDFEEKILRDQIMAGHPSGGRGNEELRVLSGEVGFLPRTHGSSLFTRGETQAMVTATLGTVSDQQRVDGLRDEFTQSFMLHYNFPPFCVGEARRIMGPGRREIGHGALAEKSLAQVLPSVEDFPYTIKLVSEILESNGSSSMASVCAGTLAMMDAGVPILRPVAGISVGMISDGDDYVLITDILGEEDHYGDMDFKVAGTQKGITGIQVDLKAHGLSMDLIRETFQRSHDARMQILKVMLGVMESPRPETSVYAPKIIQVKIPVDMIGAVIGPGGKGIRRLQETTGTVI
ncbi:MAG: polyribonucleotide nucleotidyltransferase, partial [Phycisphaerae bacterium]|nr:polyribonucleotide nucleotidyltransferase [Phycisphaerae bacterium]